MTLRGEDIRCPVCRAGLADVAPDYELVAPPSNWLLMEAHCRSGHTLMVRASLSPARLEVERVFTGPRVAPSTPPAPPSPGETGGKA